MYIIIIIIKKNIKKIIKKNIKKIIKKNIKKIIKKKERKKINIIYTRKKIFFRICKKSGTNPNEPLKGMV